MNEDYQKRFPKTAKTESAQKRAELILDCAESILTTTPIDKLGVHEVSKRANLPSQAVYRLFPSPAALHFGLASRYLKQLVAELTPFVEEPDTPWQESLRNSLQHTAEFYNNNPLAMELILGPATPREIQFADRHSAGHMAKLLLPVFQRISKEQDSKIATTRMELTIDAMDSIWGYSYYLHNEITPFFVEESYRMAVSYIELYAGRY